MTDDIDPLLAERRSNPDRIVAFVDAVFAIIITILVLEIAVPSNLTEQSLRQALDEIGPTLLAFVISFFLVGMYWVWHRDLFTKVRAINRDVIWLNLLFLLPVSLVPFASAVLGEYHDEAIALRLYGLVLIAVSLVRLLLSWYLGRHPELLFEPASEHERRFGILIALVPLVFYATAMLVADISHQVSLVLYFVLPGFYFVMITVLRSRPATADEADDFS